MSQKACSLDRIDFPVGGAPLFFRRGVEHHDGPPVLFLHGGSASCDTFLEPSGSSIVDFLNGRHGMDVWLLDWRASHFVTELAPAPCNQPADTVAAQDIPLALKFINETREREGRPAPVAVIAHCLGAACLSMAIGAGHVKSSSGLGRIVLVAIGLFYEVTWDGWAKVQDRVLDRIADANAATPFITPDVKVRKWPDIMEQTFELWPEVWGPPWKDDFFRRLAFMFGQPFLVSNLHERMTEDVVRRQFGAIPFELYRHAGQNALRGFAAVVDAEGTLNPNTPNDQIPEEVAREYLRLEAFRDFDVTLMTGAANPLWHRESIDRMAEWLARRGRPATKHVLDGYGHQDLWWGKRSWDEVFPLVYAAVR
jgi:pimeloyl-ACP methyl ester carboxylesterase